MQRFDRINQELKKQLAYIIENEIKDPRIVGITTVLRVECAEDLKTCKVYLSIIGAEGKEKEVMKVYQNSAGFVRNCLKTRIELRALPQLKFIYDDSIEYGFKISKLLQDIKDN
ncbi:MAG: 30S ribosome-binding factor RbfA [Clostridia bacterium]